MGTWRTADHTADLIIEGEGATPADLLEALLAGLAAELVTGGREGAAQRRLVATGEGWGETVPRILGELLELTLYEGFVPVRCEVTSLTETGAEVACRGEPFDPARHRLHELKAVTYHECLFAARDGRWVGRVVVDV